MWRYCNPCVMLAGILNGATTKGNHMAVPQKLKMELSDDPVIPPLGRYPKEFKAGSQRNIFLYHHVHKGIIRNSPPKNQKTKIRTNPEAMKYSTDKWRNKMWHTHKMQYYSVLKEVLRHTMSSIILKTTYFNMCQQQH